MVHLKRVLRQIGLGFVTTGILMATAQVSAREQELMLEGGDYAIPAIVHLPEQSLQANPAPLVILLHGTAGVKDEVGDLYKRLAGRLGKNGIASIRLDFAGTGDSPVDYQQYTLTSAVRDAQVALNYAVALPQTDPDRLAVVGFSQGGLIAQLLVTDPASPPINHFVGWASMASNDEGVFADFFEQYYAEAKANGYASVKFEWRDKPLNFSLKWFEEISDNNSLTRLKNYRGNMLFIAGDADETVPSSQSKLLQQTALQASTELHLIPKANHLFNVIDGTGERNPDQTQAIALLDLTQGWLIQQLKPLRD